MLKKYLPFILLIAAGIFFFWIKDHQRGPAKHNSLNRELTLSESETTLATSTAESPVNRSIQNIIFSRHARCRMGCRHIDEIEIREILKDGHINYDKVEESDKGKTYPVEGITHDNQHLRIVVAPSSNELTIVTVIDLDHDWACDCK